MLKSKIFHPQAFNKVLELTQNIVIHIVSAVLSFIVYKHTDIPDKQIINIDHYSSARSASGSPTYWVHSTVGSVHATFELGQKK